jgi:hypothetical protein
MKRLSHPARRTTLLIALCAVSAFGTTAMAQFAPLMARPTDLPRPAPAESWRLAIHDGAESNGTISFRIWLKEESPMHVDVPITQGESEAAIANATRAAIGARLGDRYQVSVDGGDAVVIQAYRGSPEFTVELLRDTARDVDVAVAQE